MIGFVGDVDEFSIRIAAPNHVALHHPTSGQHEIVEVIHFDGWPVVEPSILVPPHVLVGV